MMYGMGCVLLLAGLPAFGAPDNDGMRDELDQLRTLVQQQQAQLQTQDQRLASQDQRIAQMRRQAEEQWLTAQRADEIKSLVREVLSDAETRASLMDSAITAGHDGSNFFLAGEDGNFMMKIRGMLQARYVFNRQNEQGPALTGDAGGDENRGGFENSRTRFSFSGNVIDPSWQYMLWAGYDSSGGAQLLDAYITKVLDGHWSVTVGQFKLPFEYEYLVSETSLQFIDRSLIAGKTCGTYTQGVVLTYQDDLFRARASVNDGTSATNSAWSKRGNEFAVTGRGEVKVMGDWKDYNDWEAWKTQNPLLVFGSAVHWQNGEYGTTDNTEVESLRWTVDASLEQPGWNLFAAVIGEHDSRATSADSYMVLVQGGVFVTDDAELIGRYEWGDSDMAANDDLSVVTAGANYFFHKHQLKCTLDVGYAFNGVGSAFASNTLGWRQDAAGADGQVVVRTQVQMLF
ncbi:MAG: porin [Phycisphaerales bacterium]